MQWVGVECGRRGVECGRRGELSAEGRLECRGAELSAEGGLEGGREELSYCYCEAKLHSSSVSVVYIVRLRIIFFEGSPSKEGFHGTH